MIYCMTDRLFLFVIRYEIRVILCPNIETDFFNKDSEEIFAPKRFIGIPISRSNNYRFQTAAAFDLTINSSTGSPTGQTF